MQNQALYPLLWQSLFRNALKGADGQTLAPQLYQHPEELAQTIEKSYAALVYAPWEESAVAGEIFLPLLVSDFIKCFLIFEPATRQLFFEEYHDRGGIEHSDSALLSVSEVTQLKDCAFPKLDEKVKAAYRFTLSYAYRAEKPF
ncbi:MAG: hypothetical protein OHK0053_34490 [Microscillaceae bacterium]